jgi:peptidoglycan/LPS O-acetylase OafA/YrhL
MRRSYIPELDGFRALAVMLVVAYHMTAPLIVGGFIGVWIFFVLSSYLITSLLIAELDRRGSVDVRRFYSRRAIRLYPALVIGVVVAIAVAAITDRGTGQTVAAASFALTYLTNVESWFGPPHHGYLDHTWSLAVEAQFYLLWPFVMAALYRWGRLVVARPRCSSRASRCGSSARTSATRARSRSSHTSIRSRCSSGRGSPW